jgi:NTP pyrophosphatase (non-canonical NTP hydrolase)
MLNALKKKTRFFLHGTDEKTTAKPNRARVLDLIGYQNQASKTALPVTDYKLDPGQVYALLGLVNEAGEFGGLIKKAVRGDYGPDPANNLEFRRKLIDELGDTLWYLSESAKRFKISLDDVAQKNLEKLSDRANRGVLQGSGGDR